MEINKHAKCFTNITELSTTYQKCLIQQNENCLNHVKKIFAKFICPNKAQPIAVSQVCLMTITLCIN